MKRKAKAKVEMSAEKLQEKMQANQVAGDNVKTIDFANRSQAEEALVGTDRFKEMTPEKQQEALSKVRELASNREPASKKKRKNQDLPGMKGEGVEAVVHDDIEDAKDEYVVNRDSRMAFGKKEVEAKKNLINLMKAKKLMIYKTNDGSVVTRKHKDETDDIKITKPEPEEIAE
jgi:hypothetical protein